jgi:toxin FitB
MAALNVVDSSGWLEFFTAGANGPQFKAVIENEDHLLVPVIALYEVHRRLSHLVSETVANRAVEVMQRGTVLDLTATRAIAASKVAQQHKLAFADAAMYAIAREHNALFWTQDADYQGMPGVRLFPKPVAQSAAAVLGKKP